MGCVSMSCRAQKTDMSPNKLIKVVQPAEHRLRNDLSASQRHRRTAWRSPSKRTVRSPPIIIGDIRGYSPS
jgi:hypothetical protein